MPLGYSVSQLLKYHAYCRSNASQPALRVLPPGGKLHWDDMFVGDWLRWFTSCLMAKCSRGLLPTGKGNRAKRRIAELADKRAECKWCGSLTGKASKHWCDGDCKRQWSGF